MEICECVEKKRGSERKRESMNTGCVDTQKTQSLLRRASESPPSWIATAPAHLDSEFERRRREREREKKNGRVSE